MIDQSTTMKIAFISLLVLVGTSAGIQQPAPVVDMEGHQLQTGVHYYILPTDSSGAGGLVLARRGFMCPMNVAQLNADTSNGMPLAFVPLNATETTVVEGSTKVRIVFAAATICVQSTAWRIEEVDRTTRRRYVTTGQGPTAGSSWFRIERTSDGKGYDIVYCPVLCVACESVCVDQIGVYDEQGKRWLGLSQVPLSVAFKRV